MASRRKKKARRSGPFEFGAFDGSTFYRNKLHADETFERGGHVRLEDLVPPGGGVAALATTPDAPTAAFLETHLGKCGALVVATHAASARARAMGDAELAPIGGGRAEWRWCAVRLRCDAATQLRRSAAPLQHNVKVGVHVAVHVDVQQLGGDAEQEMQHVGRRQRTRGERSKQR